MYGSSSGKSYWKHSERVIEEQIIQMIKYLLGGTIDDINFCVSIGIQRFGLWKRRKQFKKIT